MSLELVMYRGDDRTFTFALTADDLPVDLTTASIVFTARADIDDATPTLSLSTTGGDIVIDPDQVGAGKGKLTVTIPAADTVAIARNTTLLCDLEVTDGGVTRTWPEAIYGQSSLIRLRIRGDITHA
jgi:hypothetical protein